MSDLPPVVFRPPDAEEGEYAIIIDVSIDAVYLRDLCRKAAQEHHTRWSKATRRMAAKDNLAKYECFRKYADRFEDIRKDVADRMGAKLKGESDGSSS